MLKYTSLFGLDEMFNNWKTLSSKILSPRDAVYIPNFLTIEHMEQCVWHGPKFWQFFLMMVLLVELDGVVAVVITPN